VSVDPSARNLEAAASLAAVLADDAAYLRDLVEDLRRGRGDERVLGAEVGRVASAVRSNARALCALCAPAGAGVIDRQDREDFLLDALASAAAQLNLDPPGNARRALATIEEALAEPWAARETTAARLCRVVEDALQVAEGEGRDMAMEPWCSLARAVHDARGG